jgi:hypothetical protein
MSCILGQPFICHQEAKVQNHQATIGFNRREGTTCAAVCSSSTLAFSGALALPVENCKGLIRSLAKSLTYVSKKKVSHLQLCKATATSIAPPFRAGNDLPPPARSKVRCCLCPIRFVTSPPLYQVLVARARWSVTAVKTPTALQSDSGAVAHLRLSVFPCAPHCPFLPPHHCVQLPTTESPTAAHLQ